MSTEPSRRWWWLGWSWKIASATYLVGFLTFLPFQMLLVWWSALLYTPLVIVTLNMTRSLRLAKFGIPVVLAALIASGYLIYAGRSQQGLPTSTIFSAIWLVGVLGPFVLFFLVTRHLRASSTSTDGEASYR